MLVAALGTLALLAGLGAWAGRRRAAVAPAPRPPTYEAVVLSAFLTGLVKLARKKRFLPGELNSLVNTAIKLGLPKTARAINNESSLPADEMWPGTQTSVRDRVMLKLNTGV